MREILFRGKTKVIAGSEYNMGKPDGEWVRGYLYNDVGCWKIRQFETSYADYIGYEVGPETVGQYTGISDKNGNRIFEGDICKHRSNYSGNTVISVVTYTDGHFLALVDEHSGFELSEKLEVIGNIHDNPELLKGGAENGTK